MLGYIDLKLEEKKNLLGRPFENSSFAGFSLEEEEEEEDEEVEDRLFDDDDDDELDFFDFFLGIIMYKISNNLTTTAIHNLEK